MSAPLSVTNVTSYAAQRYLASNTETLAKISERLSSGLRINRAGDDAAGLSVSMGLGLDVRVASQGIRNTSDGISLLNIADGALSTLSGVITRLRELATQSANGTISDRQRQSLDKGVTR